MPVPELVLCNFCFSAVKDFRSSAIRDRKEWTIFHPSFVALKISAVRCPTCLLLWRSARRSNGGIISKDLQTAAYREILNAQQRPYSDLLHRQTDLPPPHPSQQLLMRCYITARIGCYAESEPPSQIDHTETHIMSMHFELRLPADNSLWGANARFEQLLESDDEGPGGPGFRAASKPVLHMAKLWLNTCLNTHEACRPAIDKTALRAWRPTRLLKITDLSRRSSGLRLCEAANNDYDVGVAYIALSHRWASSKQVLLLDSTLDEFRRELPSDHLKASIRDALRIATYLGVQYLWIDSLCIIQDNDGDKAHEISQMDKIYLHSTLTVAASDASADDEGCFIIRPDVVIEGSKIQRLEEGQSADISHYICEREVWNSGKEMSAVQNSVLASRAWVFQERLLSPRTLHCCRHQFHWECHTLEASEQQPQGPGDEQQYMHSAFKSLLSDRLETSETQDLAETEAEAQDGWRRIVESYSRGNLTFPEDKLRALAGVTAVWQRSHHADEYIFGLWRSTLLSDLCWMPLHDQGLGQGNKPSPSAPFIAPSWSWASVNLPVFFHPGIGLSAINLDENCIALREVESSAGRSPLAAFVDHPKVLGQSDTATLHLRGHPVEAVCGPCFQGQAHSTFRRLLQAADHETATLNGASDSSELSSSERSPGPDPDPDDNYVVLDDRYGEPPPRIVCLPLVIEDASYTLDIDMEMSWGLALVTVPGNPAYFRRVGIFRTSLQGMFEGEATDLCLV